MVSNVCGSRLNYYLCNGLKNNPIANLVLFFNHVKTVPISAVGSVGLCLLTSAGLFLLASSCGGWGVKLLRAPHYLSVVCLLLGHHQLYA